MFMLEFRGCFGPANLELKKLIWFFVDPGSLMIRIGFFLPILGDSDGFGAV